MPSVLPIVLGTLVTDYCIVDDFWYALIPLIVEKLTEVYSFGYFIGASQDFHEIALRFIGVPEKEIERILPIHGHN